MATVATHPQEAMLKAAALEVVLELPLDIRRQILVLRRQMRLERRVILLDKWLKEGALRAGRNENPLET